MSLTSSLSESSNSMIRSSPPEFYSAPSKWSRSSFDNWRRVSQEDFEVLDSPPADILHLNLRTSKENRPQTSSKVEAAAEPVLCGPKMKNNSNFSKRFKKIEKREKGLKAEFHPVVETPFALMRNRYDNVKPSSEGLIFLKHCAAEESSYINANQFEGMIITQAPFIRLHDYLAGKKFEIDTVADFWMLAFEQGTDIVCLTDPRGLDNQNKLIEKAFPYWNPIDKEIVFKKTISLFDQAPVELEVRLLVPPITAVEPNEKGECVSYRVFEIQLGDQIKQIGHWYFEKWVDHSVCDAVQLAHLIELLLEKPDTIPIIHCSAGIGRSGVFAIAFKFIKRYLETQAIPTEIEIDDAVIELRKRRPRSVQSANQLGLISTTISAFIDKQLKKEK